MSVKTKTFLSTFILLSMMISTAKADTSLQTPTKASERGYLFVQSARKATIQENHDKTYTVTLRDVMPYVTYFSDRPERYANSMPLSDFLMLWHDKGAAGFQVDSPNVDLYGIQMKILTSDRPVNFILELSNPDYDEETHVLKYKAAPMKNNKHPLPQLTSFQYVTLFIDNVCLVCWNGN